MKILLVLDRTLRLPNWQNVLLDSVGHDRDQNGEDGRNQEGLGAFDWHFQALDSTKRELYKLQIEKLNLISASRL